MNELFKCELVILNLWCFMIIFSILCVFLGSNYLLS